MKKILVLITALMAVNSLFSQQTLKDSVQHGTKDYYLQKSKRQKSGAWALLIGGTALMGAGLLIGDNKNADFDQAGTGAVMFGIGFLADLGSIPLFIASSKNKRRAIKASASLKIQDAFVIQTQSMINSRFPAISFQIRL